MADFSMNWQRIDPTRDVVVIRLAGAVDYADQKFVETQFASMLTQENPKHVLMDFREITFVVTPFLGSLLFWREQMMKRGGSLVLFGLRRGMAVAVEHLYLQRVLTICEDEEAA